MDIIYSKIHNFGLEEEEKTVKRYKKFAPGRGGVLIDRSFEEKKNLLI